ncbi:MAG: tetratricopeptide repeat protein [Candidatus Tectimicrobiota bacterium]
MEYAKGLVAYDMHDYLTALESFRRAAQLDQENPHAFFYLGLSLSRLAEFPDAIVAFQKALALDRSLRYVHYHLGVAYFQEARYVEALEHFAQAAHFDPQKATTQLYLGYTHVLLKHYQAALPFLQQAMRLDSSLSQQSQYYQGVALYALERDMEARMAFQNIAQQGSDGATAEAARRYLDALQAREREQRFWHIDAEASVQYDSNVTLESNGEVVDFGRRADAVALLSVTARLLPLRTRTWQLGGEYSFFQSQHFTLHDFDLQSHTGTLFGRLKWGDTVVRVAADYHYTFLANASFASELGVLPSVTFWENEMLYTVASLRYRQSIFFNQLLDSDAEAARNRDGWETRLGLDQYLLFNGKRAAARISYYTDVSRSAGTDWEYNGHQVGLGLSVPLHWSLRLAVDATYQQRHYLHTNSFHAETLGVRDLADRRARRDDVYLGVVTVTRDLGRYLTVAAAFAYAANVSNIAFFDYRRHLATLSLQGRY